MTKCDFCTQSFCEECKFITEQKQEVVGGVEIIYFCTKHGFAAVYGFWKYTKWTFKDM